MNDEQILQQASVITALVFERRASVLLTAFGHESHPVSRPRLKIILIDLLWYIEHPTEIYREDILENVKSIGRILNHHVDREIQDVIDRALMAAYGDELRTIAQAATDTGATVKKVSAWATRGAIRVFNNPDAPNPRSGRRLVLAAEVQGAVDAQKEKPHDRG